MEHHSHGRLMNTAGQPPHGVVPDSVWELGLALQAALASPRATVYSDRQRVLRMLQTLRYRLDHVLDTTENRLAPRCVSQYFGFAQHCARKHGMPLRGATYLDFGCGSINPCARMFAHLMAGAKRGICVELDPVQDIAEAARALADLVAAAVINPPSVFADMPVRPEDALANLAGIDLPRLAAGDAGGIPADRLALFSQPLETCGIPDASIDVVCSNSVFEHLPDVGAVLDTMHRILRPGGYAMHGIDTADHRWYGDPGMDRLEFLTEDSAAPLVGGCNRLRFVDYERIFPQHGFEILDRLPNPAFPTTPELRARLAPPWREMPDEHLDTTWCNFLVRRL